MNKCAYFDAVEYQVCSSSDDEASFGFFSYLDNTETSVVIGVDTEEIFVMYTSYTHKNAVENRRSIMKDYLHYDLVDVPVMIGAGFFISSISGLSWAVFSDAPAPSGLGMATAVAGIVIGAIVSVKARDSR
ncbi:hypothetical protein [Pseudomonas fluorescens]|uniref:hypothetical protein n=1 Tax=Pseudomonas fluorescens TaxID=294 RepID=UPI000641E67F|nr:hypothetical protein [Pseudomonas fluorescens]